MPLALKRFHQSRQLHFITFTCYHRTPLLATAAARATVEQTLERVRRWYGFCVYAYVIMPEHVHLLINEPERGDISVAMQMLKQTVAHKLGRRIWQRRYYDFNLWSAPKLKEKLRYIHGNPVRRGPATPFRRADPQKQIAALAAVKTRHMGLCPSSRTNVSSRRKLNARGTIATSCSSL